MNKFKCYGVLWNSSYTFANDFFKDIDSTYSIENLYFLDIKNFKIIYVQRLIFHLQNNPKQNIVLKRLQA